MAPEPGSKSSRGSDAGVLEAGSGKEVDGAYFFFFFSVLPELVESTGQRSLRSQRTGFTTKQH